MILSLILFCAVCLVLIHYGYQWLDNYPRKTRNLVSSQTEKYKQMLDKLLLETPPPISPGTATDVNDLEQDLLVFSNQLMHE